MKGSYSTVFKGVWMNTEVAIKRCLIVDLLDDPLKDFLKESEILSNLRHQNIVRFLGAGKRYF
jgi:serine/threonine protein kinase